MPKAKKPAYNKKRKNRISYRKVKSRPLQIQNAAFVMKSRLLKFCDFRSYIVIDDGWDAGGALPPVLEIASNNPRKFIHSTQGTWDASSITAKGNGVPGITTWVTPLVPSSVDVAPYMNASVLSCRLTVTAVPVPTQPDEEAESDTFQDVIKLCVQNNTRNGMFHNRNINNTFNSEVVSQTPDVRTCNLYYNQGGTARGGTISLNYSFKRQNAGRPALTPSNFFHSDTDPSEKDFINIALMPTHSQKYGLYTLGGVRNPNIRVEVKISYIVLLSEPNTHISLAALNAGNNLPAIPGAPSIAFVRKLNKVD